ncbi:MAG: unsaturated rhamnogalacturonyl hydrolase [Phycisphaerales bacterium]|nr:unsaturated rhamnogalacturonyl hydrolase [Phycisphaerales bacterium]
MTISSPRTACAVLLLLLVAIALTGTGGCAAADKDKDADPDNFTEKKEKVKAKPDAPKPWSLRMAKSIVAQDRDAPQWNDRAALAAHAVALVGVSAGDPALIDYGKKYIEAFIDKKGKITTPAYEPKKYEVDDVAPGRLILLLHRQLRQPRYRIAADALIEQLKTQPRTLDGGYWHSKETPQQIWIDDVFVTSPFMAEYAQVAQDSRWLDEAANQIIVIAAHARDPKSGLYFHGWDAARTQRWANRETGTSPTIWGAGVGWYAAAVVETLERLPRDHPRRAEVLEIYRNLADAIAAAQDPATGVWWQVMDQPGRKGNYLESSGSCLCVYALAKGVRLGLLDEKHAEVARKGYDGIVKQFAKAGDRRDRVLLTDSCATVDVSSYRDGSYDSYIRARRDSNDPKAAAAFVLASLEMRR